MRLTKLFKGIHDSRIGRQHGSRFPANLNPSQQDPYAVQVRARMGADVQKSRCVRGALGLGHQRIRAANDQWR